jgi:hypothetical protein
MSTGAVIAIVVGVVVVLGALAFFTLARRSDVRGAGALSGETRERDREARKGRAYEAEAVAAASRARPPAAPGPPWPRPTTPTRRSSPGPRPIRRPSASPGASSSTAPRSP